MQLSKNSDVQRVMNAVAAGTTTQNSTGVDMADASGVNFVVAFGAITATGVPTVKVQHSDDNSNWNDVEGSLQTFDDTISNKIVEVDVNVPTKRYVRVVIGRGTANAVIDGVVARKYGLRKKPHATHSTVAGLKALAGTTTGTA